MPRVCWSAPCIGLLVWFVSPVNGAFSSYATTSTAHYHHHHARNVDFDFQSTRPLAWIPPTLPSSYETSTRIPSYGPPPGYGWPSPSSSSSHRHRITDTQTLPSWTTSPISSLNSSSSASSTSASSASPVCKVASAPASNSFFSPSFPNSSYINSWLETGPIIKQNVAHVRQNGKGLYGQLPSRQLSSCMECESGVPWSGKTATGTNPYENPPQTGVTRYYDLTISRGTLAPDGYDTPMVLINGQFPGPLLECNWGDTFQITVHNALSNPEEGTTLHWHGLLQTDMQWWDGVPSISMCPIAPGTSFTYTFQAHLFGTTWYHSHYSAQYAGGALGPMVIHGPTDNFPEDATDVIDLGPVIVSDHYHTDYFTLVEQAVGAGTGDPPFLTSDNTLIQGKGNTDCSKALGPNQCTTDAGTAKFAFHPGKTHRLRFINTSAQALFFLSIDAHEMTVVELDFVPVVPYTVTQLQLAVGQRADVLVQANADPSAYWLRAYQTCSPSNQPYALAAIYYSPCDTSLKPTSAPYPDFNRYNTDCASDALSLTVPAYSIPLPAPETTYVIDITQEVNATGHKLYAMNGKTYRGNYNHPLLNLTYNGRTWSAANRDTSIIDFGTNETMRIVFNNLTPYPHPMHVHGQNMYVLDFGAGTSDGQGTVLRPENPMRRDVQILQANGYLVTQLTADNPGVWPFHCHIVWHTSQGLYVNVLQKPKVVQGYDMIPEIVGRSCGPWAAWSDDEVVDQIDSGLRVREEGGRVRKRFSPY